MALIRIVVLDNYQAITIQVIDDVVHFLILTLYG